MASEKIEPALTPEQWARAKEQISDLGEHGIFNHGVLSVGGDASLETAGIMDFRPKGYAALLPPRPAP